MAIGLSWKCWLIYWIVLKKKAAGGALSCSLTIYQAFWCVWCSIHPQRIVIQMPWCVQYKEASFFKTGLASALTNAIVSIMIQDQLAVSTPPIAQIPWKLSWSVRTTPWVAPLAFAEIDITFHFSNNPSQMLEPWVSNIFQTRHLTVHQNINLFRM